MGTPTAAPPAATASSGSGWDFSEITRSDASLRRFLHGLPGVDQVGAEARAATLGTRSIKTTAKAWAIDLAIRMVDLTTLEGADTPGKVRALCAKALRPDPADPTCPAVAAVCVYPDHGRRSPRRRCGGTGVHVASVATAFPSGQAPLDGQARRHPGRGRRRRRRDRHGDRPGRVPGRPLPRGLRGDRRGQGGLRRRAHLKVILETGELAPTTTSAARPGWRCWPAATSSRPPPARSRRPRRCRSRWSCSRRSATSATPTGSQVGVKPAGGIRTTKDAIKYLVMVNETAGDDWLDPDWFRFGASTPAQRPADAAHQADHRPLLRPRLLHAGLIAMAQRSSTPPPPSPARIVDIKPSYGLFIDGEFVDPATAARSRPINPATEEVLAEVAEAGAGRRRPRRRGRPPRVRDGLGADARRASAAKYLFRIARIIQERARELAVLESLDNGKPIRESRDVDMPLVAAHFFYYAGWADKLEYAGFGPTRSRWAWPARSSRGTSRCSCWPGRSRRRWPPATRSCSSRPRPRR